MSKSSSGSQERDVEDIISSLKIEAETKQRYYTGLYGKHEALRAEMERLTKRAELAEAALAQEREQSEQRFGEAAGRWRRERDRADAAESKLAEHAAFAKRIVDAGFPDYRTSIRSIEAMLGTLDHCEAAEESALDKTVTTKVAALVKAMGEVDDILCVNWVGPRKDGDYRKALHDLVTNAIMEHDDPALSEVAAKREALLAKLIPVRLEEMAEQLRYWAQVAWPTHLDAFNRRNAMATELRDIAAAVRGMGK